MSVGSLGVMGDVASFPSLFFSIDTAQNNIFPFLKIARHLILLHQDIWQHQRLNVRLLQQHTTPLMI